MLMISGKIMKDSHKTYIKSFSLQGLWGYKEVEWTTINSDVNVLVGINGSGKNYAHGYHVCLLYQ